MISGISTPSITTAIRTAGQARATMDTMTRQIATGQRVSSAKDDGAAWTRANGLRSEARTAQTKAQMVDGVIALNQVPVITAEIAAEAATRFRDIMLQALDAAGSSPATRAQIAETWTQTVLAYDNAQALAIEQMEVDGVYWPSDEVDGFGSWFRPFNGIADMESMRLRRSGWVMASMTGWAADILAGNRATLEARVAALESNRNGYALAATGAGIEETKMERFRDRFDETADRLDAAAANLTDADLGKASAARALAETRQQLALSTVRQAISTYGNFAGGLLANVQRTQRGVTA